MSASATGRRADLRRGLSLGSGSGPRPVLDSQVVDEEVGQAEGRGLELGRPAVTQIQNPSMHRSATTSPDVARASIRSIASAGSGLRLSVFGEASDAVPASRAPLAASRPVTSPMRRRRSSGSGRWWASSASWRARTLGSGSWSLAASGSELFLHP